MLGCLMSPVVGTIVEDVDLYLDDMCSVEGAVATDLRGLLFFSGSTIF